MGQFGRGANRKAITINMDRQSQIELVLERYENPKHKTRIDDADVDLEGGNPGCGDIIHLFINITNERIEQIGFEGEGCTISQASTDFLAELIQGMSLEEIEKLDHQSIVEILGEEIVQNRAKCALLPLDTLKLALRKYRGDQVLAKLKK